MSKQQLSKKPPFYTFLGYLDATYIDFLKFQQQQQQQ